MHVEQIIAFQMDQNVQFVRQKYNIWQHHFFCSTILVNMMVARYIDFGFKIALFDPFDINFDLK